MVGGVTNMKKIFFAFLDELAHSKQFWKVGKMTFPWLPPPAKVGKIPEIFWKFLDEIFPKLVEVMKYVHNYDKLSWFQFLKY